jgi:integrase
LKEPGKESKYASVTPYRFRHTVATLLMTLFPQNTALIAERLGHTSPRFTKRRYTNLERYLHFPRAELKEFWRWLNEEYFEKPGRKIFKSSKPIKDEAIKLY